jgi:hypothetical protein
MNKLSICFIIILLVSLIAMSGCNECIAEIDYFPDESGFMHPEEREKLAKKTAFDYCEENEIDMNCRLRGSYMYYLDDEDTGYLYVFYLNKANEPLRVVVTADGDKAYIE